MSVNNLENQEQGMNLSNREPKGAEGARQAIERVKKGGPPSAETELADLRGRLDAAREIKPDGGFRDSNQAEAWLAGRDAAIKAIEGE